MYIEYNDSDSYVNIKEFMMDLIPENNIIILEFVLLISTKKILALKNIIEEKEIKDFVLFSKYLSKNFMRFFEIKKYSRRYAVESEESSQDVSTEIDNSDIQKDSKEDKLESEKQVQEIDNSDIQKVIKVVGIRADRAVSNDDRNHVLSNLTEKYYHAYKNKQDDSKSIFNTLEKKLEAADMELHKIYNGKEGIFSNVIEVIKTYGGTENGISISIESAISEKNLLSDNTNLCYKQENNYSLPETYNGLGYLNLIGILFEIETKIQELYEQPADINILYIEEPEAHTHPQLQYIFIRNIRKHINQHRNQLIKSQNKNIQVMITSHSSHIVSACDFDDIIYLKKKGNYVVAKSFNSLKDEYKGNKQQGFKFVKQYLTLNRSELFFADKVICIEGDTERMLIPSMMKKVDDGEHEESNGKLPLLSQNISIIEVGAYSHVFMPLFMFLGIQVLIITDIDTAKKNNKNKYVKCNPKEATHTSNASIKVFFEEDKLDTEEQQFKALINKRPKDKIKKNIRIAYQIPEPDNDYQASSFEDAFISLNKDFILKNKNGLYKYGALKNFNESDIKECYEFVLSKIGKKTAFASSLLYFDGEKGETWKVPYYIKEGLLWIQ